MYLKNLKAVFAAVEEWMRGQMQEEGSHENAIGAVIDDFQLIGESSGYPEGDRPIILVRPGEAYIFGLDEDGKLQFESTTTLEDDLRAELGDEEYERQYGGISPEESDAEATAARQI